MPKEKSAGTIVIRTEQGILKTLLLHYGHGHWDFPKGHIEQGETETQTALRELQEETGITDARIINGFQEMVSYYFRSRGQTIYKEVIYYIVETQTSSVVLSHEHSGFLWLTYEEALEKLTFANSREKLQNAFRFLKNKSPA